MFDSAGHTGSAHQIRSTYQRLPGGAIRGRFSPSARSTQTGSAEAACAGPLNVPVCTPRDLETFGNRGTWEDEELWNYEAGTKSTFLGGRGTLNVSGFYMDIRNLQATVTAGSCSSRIIFNVPESRSAGMEFEIAAQPTPLFDFAVAASVADAKLQSTLESYDAAGNSTGIIAGIEEGKRLPTTPLFQATAAATCAG